MLSLNKYEYVVSFVVRCVLRDLLTRAEGDTTDTTKPQRTQRETILFP